MCVLACEPRVNTVNGSDCKSLSSAGLSHEEGAPEHCDEDRLRRAPRSDDSVTDGSALSPMLAVLRSS